MEYKKKLTESELCKVNKHINNIIIPNNNVYKELKNFLNGNSKRIRSVLTVLYLKMNGKEISDDIISLITAGEIIHNASLLHDDVIDNAKIRRGNLTIGEQFSPSISILAGDYLLSEAIKIISNINNKKVTNTILKCTKKMADAEINQYILRSKMPTKEEYIEICEGKTASLFEAILTSAAILSDINSDTAFDFGKLFGILFQIKNDISVNSIKSDSDNNINTAYNIFGIEKTQVLIDNYIEEIRSILNKFPNNEYKKGLEDLLEKL